MSQNRDKVNHTTIVSRLRETGNPPEKAVADEMEKTIQQSFAKVKDS